MLLKKKKHETRYSEFRCFSHHINPPQTSTQVYKSSRLWRTLALQEEKKKKSILASPFFTPDSCLETSPALPVLQVYLKSPLHLLKLQSLFGLHLNL